MERARFALAAVSFLAFALALASCGPSERRTAPVPTDTTDGEVEVLLLGLDGASFDLMEPLIARGALPNLERLIKEGVSARLRSDLPCLSIVLWTSLATGKTPESHGIRDWSFTDPETGEKGVNNSSRRRVEALWNVASANGKSVGFVSWWATWPAEPVNGFIVSDQFTRLEAEGKLEQATYPEELAHELRGALDPGTWSWLHESIASGALKLLSDREGVGSSPSDLEARYRQAWFLYGQDYRSERALFRLLEASSRPALLGYLSRKIDIASHYMWQFADGPRPDAETLSELVAPAYTYEDALVGRLLEELGPETNVVIVSDHGFTWESDGFGHEETAPDGIFIAHGPAFDRGRKLDPLRLYDVTPVVLRALSMPLARDLEGRVPSGVFRDDHPEPRYVETYEQDGGRDPSGVSSPLDERILEELRALGYVP